MKARYVRGLIFLFFFGSLSFFLIRYITHVDRNDVLEYERLLQMANGKSAKFSLSRLYRKNVIKEIWWNQKGSEHPPLYARIECTHSELIAAQEKANLGLIEKCENVKSLYQEKLFYQLPDGRKAQINDDGKVIVKDQGNEQIIDNKVIFPMQDIRYFEADHGISSYKNFDFIGENVRMKKFQLRSHTPPSSFSSLDNPISIGEGKKMRFILKEKGIDLQCDGLKTTFHPKKGI